MEYGRILTHAWKATWKYPWMWLFASSLMLGNGGLWRVLNILPDLSELAESDVWSQSDVQYILFDNWLIWALLAVCILLLWVTFVVCHFIAIGSVYAGAAAARKGEVVRFKSLLYAGLSAFWKNLGFGFITTIAGFGIMLVIVVPLVILVFIPIIGWVVIVFAVLALIVLSLPLRWVITSWYNIATQYITLQDASLQVAATKAWQYWRKHWIASLVLYAAQLGVGIVVGVVMFLALLIIGLTVAFFGYFAYTSQAWLAFGLVIAFGITFFTLVALVLKGIHQSFLAHLWHGYYASGQD